MQQYNSIIIYILIYIYIHVYIVYTYIQNSPYYQLIVAVIGMAGGRASRPPGESKTTTFDDIPEEDGPCRTLNIHEMGQKES